VQRWDAVCGDARRSLRGIHNPAPRGSRRAKKVKEVQNLKEVMPISRENGCVGHICALGRQRQGQLATESKKRVRDLGALLLVRIPCGEQETLEGYNPKEASGGVFG
jgi:hypothetical protein